MTVQIIKKTKRYCEKKLAFLTNLSLRSLILDFHVHVKVSSRLNGLNSEAFVLNTFLNLTCVWLSCTNKLWCFSSFDSLRRDLQRHKHPDFIEIFFYPFVPLIKLSFESLLMICWLWYSSYAYFSRVKPDLVYSIPNYCCSRLNFLCI